MSDKSFSNELQRVLARPDADELMRQIEAYHDDFRSNPDELDEDVDAVMTAHFDDPEKAFAYAILAMANYDEEDFLYYVAAGPLEDSLREPSEDLVQRVIIEARRTPRFRWMLNGVFPHAIREDVAERIVQELGGWVEEYPAPPRPWA